MAIHYTTGLFTLHQIIGKTLLLSKENDPEYRYQKPNNTFMLAMQPGLFIINYQELSDVNKYD